MILLCSALALAVPGILKPIWVDELLEFFADNQPVRGLLDTQMHHPFSLDPPGFHLIVHVFFNVLPPSILTQRLPSLLFFLLAQYAIFCIVRGLVHTRAALLAMLLPMITYARHYGSEGRPFALLLAMAATSLLFWYRATTGEPGTQRTLSLVGLAASLALAVVSHYFGFLLLIPLAAAEFVRLIALHRTGRRTDLQVLAAIGASLAALLLNGLCLKAVLEFRPHYSPQMPEGPALLFTYGRLFAVSHLRHAETYLAFLGAGIVALLWLSLRTLRRLNPNMHPDSLALWMAPALLLLLPFAGVVLLPIAKAYDPRYVLPTITGFSVLMGIGLEEPLRNRRFFAILMTAIGVTALSAAAYDIAIEQKQRATLFDVLAPHLDLPVGWVDGAGHPTEAIYTRSPEALLQAHYALPPPAANSFVLVYSETLDHVWAEDDVSSRTAANLARTYPGFRILSYEEFRRLPGPHRVRIVNHAGDPDEWLDWALARDGYGITPQQVTVGGVDAVVTAPAQR